MKLFGGSGKHSGSSRSAHHSSQVNTRNDIPMPELDDILSEEFTTDSLSAFAADIPDILGESDTEVIVETQSPAPVQEMREYIPSRPVAASSPVTGYSTFEDDDDAGVVPMKPTAPHISAAPASQVSARPAAPMQPAAYPSYQPQTRAAVQPQPSPANQNTVRMPSVSYTSASRYTSNSSLGRGIDPQNLQINSSVRGYVRPGSTPAAPPKATRQRSSDTGKKRRRWPITLGATALVLASLYCLCVFSNIPFIAKWRAIYIETAMGTMTHQWLATAFIPRSIIEDVMYERWKLEEQQTQIESNKDLVKPSVTTMGALRTEATTTTAEPAATTAATTVTTVPPVPEWEKDDYPLYIAFPELDRASFIAYANEHAETLYTDDGHIMIDESGRDQEGTSITTVNGDQVLALDTRNGILIVKVTGQDSGEIYEGKLAFIRDPAQVKLGTAKNLGSVGQQAGQIAKRTGAILAINASGFQDDEGKGNGGHAYGFVMSDGKLLQQAIGGKYKVIAFDEDNVLHITNYKSSLNLRDGAEFRPGLIINGKVQVTGSAGWGIQPRTVIGQSEDGTVMMLVIDGRQTHSIGATIGECAVILERYGAVQACNLDGGSSSVLYYNGRVISNPSGADKVNGRYLPDAFIVMPAADVSDEPAAE